MRLKGSRILITAGPTWVKLDPVRVISNTATGTTGLLLSKVLAEKGCRVTLLLGPGAASAKLPGVKIVSFKFFEELETSLGRILRSGTFDAVIHSAAVSDFKPEKPSAVKIASSKKKLKLILVPAPKLIARLRRYAKKSVLIGFKYEPSSGRKVLLQEARALLGNASLDAVVANSSAGAVYKAFVVTKDSIGTFCSTKKDLVRSLLKFLEGKSHF